MVTRYNEVNPTYAVQSIRELFERNPIDRNDLLFHYGLRVLKKIIVVNQGCFKVSTPKVKDAFLAFNSEGRELEEKNIYHGTNYNILLPIDTQFASQTDESVSANTSLIDTQNILKENFAPLKIDLDIKDAIPTTQDEKDACVRFVKSQIETGVNGANRNDCIICLYQVRNEWMVDRSNLVIAVFNGQKSGTKNTVDYAFRKGIGVINVLNSI